VFRHPLTKEITAALVFKAAALIGLYFAFFSAGDTPVTPAQVRSGILDAGPAAVLTETIPDRALGGAGPGHD